MNNNFRVSFYLAGKNRTRKDGTTPIVYRIHLGTDRLGMGNTGYFIDARKWDGKAGRVLGTSNNARFINKQLEDMECDLRSIFRKYEHTDKLSLDFIRSEYMNRGEEEAQTFIPYFDAYIQKRSEDVGHGLSPASLQKYKVTRRRFTEFLSSKMNRKDLKFSEIEYPVISNFEHYLRTEVNMVNNTAIRMLKTFKTVILEATSEGLITVDPYRGMKMHMDPVDRGFLTDEELEKLMNYDFSIKRLEQVRDFFVFSCFTGLAYIDLANLTQDKIVEMNGRKWIFTRRQKTNVACNVPLLDIPLKIIEKYKGQAKGNLVLPVISNQKSNAYLKEIAAVCGIDKKLSCHLARHTFATMSLSKEVPIESVSSMLGHTNIKTTQIYARITSKKVEGDMEKLAAKLQGFGQNYANMPAEAMENNSSDSSSESAAKVQEPVSTSQAAAATTPVAPAKKRGRPRKVQTEETSAVKSTTTAYVDGRLVTTQEPPLVENKKRQRIPRGVKVETPVVRQARRR